MHHYLPSIGFKIINSRKKLSDLLQEVETSFTHYELLAVEEEIDFCEFTKEYGAGIGITVFGDLDIEEYFERQYYYPYFTGTGITSYEDVVVEKRIDRDAYIGICDDVKIGINLYFHLQNTMEYLREFKMSGTSIRHSSVTLSAMCNAGIVLLPVMKDNVQEKKQKQEVENRKLLVSAARMGDQQAIESLTLDDIDIYSKISQRLIKEDVFSIVDTYIMPNGIECDTYSILGNILEMSKIENEYTGEELYIMKMDVNDLKFDLCVPVDHVIGEPEVGRRFKADIWLQGRVNF